MSEESKPSGPDFLQGVPLANIPEDGILLGHAAGEPVLVARSRGEVFAIGAECTHYHGPLAEGLRVGDTIRCPWHHACFSLRTGAALRAPALDPVASWRVEHRDGTVFVHDKLAPAWGAARAATRGLPDSVVIIGGGAAGQAAAEMLRREGYARPVTMLSAENERPYDRPNLSKDYLAGTAPAEWLPLRPPEFYAEHEIALDLGARAVAIDARGREVLLADGTRHPWGALLLATGAEPNRLGIPGAELPNVHTLRSANDCRALIAGAQRARRAVVIGSSFIGLEVAASLRARGLDVDVVARATRPMEAVFGAEIGDLVRQVHEQHGVRFHCGATAAAIDPRGVSLHSGERLDTDLVVVGIGVHPLTALAEMAGIAVDRGVAVDGYLETSVPGIWAAGDIARWPDTLSGEPLRIEHWVVAERQGQTAARNMLGRRERFDQVPFFWTQQYDLTLCYVGHARQWDRIEIDGSIGDRDATVSYWRGGRKLAALTIGRDRDSLGAEVELERTIAAGG